MRIAIIPALAPAALALTTLAACATVPAAAPVDTGTPRVIAYATQPCFGTCPVYTITLDTATGAGTFEGTRFTDVRGRRAFTATPAQSLAFSGALDAVRRSPADAFVPGGARCGTFATDLPGVTITWRGGGAATVVRRVDFGCTGTQNDALFEQLRRAPDALAVTGFIALR